MKIYFFLY